MLLFQEALVPVASSLLPQHSHLAEVAILGHEGVDLQTGKEGPDSLTNLYDIDSHGVAQVCFVTGNKILRILNSKAFAPDLP